GIWAVVGHFLTGTVTKKGDDLSPFAGCATCSVDTDMSVQATGRVSVLAWDLNGLNNVELRMFQDKQKFLFKQKANGATVTKQAVPFSVNAGQNYHVTLRFDGTNFILF